MIYIVESVIISVLVFIETTHFRSHIKETIKKCNNEEVLCSFCSVFVSFLDLRNHYKFYLENNQTVFCEVHNKQIKSISNLDAHLHRHHSIKKNIVANGMNESEEFETFEHNDIQNIEEQIIFFFLILKCKYAVIDMVLDFIVAQFQSIVNSSRKTNVNIYFSQFSTKFKRNKNNSQMKNYIKPEKISIDSNENFKEGFIYYVPIIKSLKVILNDEDVKKSIQKKDRQDKNDILVDYYSGSNYKNNKFFQQSKKCVILLFSNSCSLNNSLGSKRKMQKIKLNYYAIGDLPVCIRNQTNNIKLAFMWNETLFLLHN